MQNDIAQRVVAALGQLVVHNGSIVVSEEKLTIPDEQDRVCKKIRVEFRGGVVEQRIDGQEEAAFKMNSHDFYAMNIAMLLLKVDDAMGS